MPSTDKLTYCDMIEEHMLTEKNMLTHNFQLGFDLHFFSESGNYTVSQDLIGVIEVIGE